MWYIMSELFNSFYIFIMNTIDALGVYGPLLGSLFIILESIIPPLPLFVFILVLVVLCHIILLKNYLETGLLIK